MSLRTLLASVVVILWVPALIAVPTAVAWAYQSWSGGTVFDLILPWAITFVSLVALSIGGLFAAVAFDRRQAERFVRENGIRCTAYIKRYDRFGRSITQQKVLFMIEYPTGPIGRDYVMTNLSAAWLADVCALGKPIRVIAHPDASTLIIES